MPPAIIAGGVAAVGAIGGAVIGSGAQKKAAKKAAKAQTEASQQQLALGRETNALNEKIYNQNRDLLNPYVQRGNAAGENINALLGLPTYASMQPPVVQQQPEQQPAEQWTHPGYVTPETMARAAAASGQPVFNSSVQGQDMLYNNPSQMPGLNPSLYGTPGMNTMLGGQFGGEQPNATFAPAPGSAGLPQGPDLPKMQQQPMNALSPQSAFDAFANSAGMQTQIKNGVNALQHSAAARGMLQSGATLKGIQNYGQQTALNNYFMPYMGLLGGQQATGAGAASSVAGVGQNFVNTAANIAGQQGQYIQNGANALSNQAIAGGVANANMWSGIGSAIGGIASSFAPR